jgi:hypothetical protein
MSSIQDRRDQIYRNSIKLAADSVESLRGADVYRVLDNMHRFNYAITGASRLIGERPDLRKWVVDALSEILTSFKVITVTAERTLSDLLELN